MAQELGRLFVVVGADIDDFKRKMGEASDGLKKTGESMTKMGKNLSLKVTAPLVGIGTAAVATVSKFDDSMSQVAALTGAVGEDFQSLRSLAQELGATTAHTASTAADAMGYLALAGWDVNQILEATPSMLSLASAGALDLATAADIVSDTMSMFQIEAEEAGRAADVFATASSKSNTNIQQLGEAMKYAGAAANAAGMDLEQTSTILGVLANSGIKGSMAGTTLTAMLSDLQASAKDGAVQVGDMTVRVYDAEGAMRDLGSIMADVEVATRNMTAEQRDAALANVFQQRSLRGTNILLASGSEAYQQLEKEIRNSAGAAKEMANTMEDNIGGAFRALASQTEGLLIQLGDILAPIIKDTVIPLVMAFGEKVKGLLEWFVDLNPTIQTIILAFVGLLTAAGPVLIILGKITTAVGTMVPVIAGLGSTIGTVVSGAGAAFASLGPILSTVGTALMALITGPAAPFVLVGAAIAGAILIWKNFGDEIKRILNELVEAIGLIMYPFIDFFVGVFISIKDGVLSVFNMMWDGIKKIINWIIDGVNIMIKGLNKFSIDVPSWIPEIGGNKFGFNIAEIPHLADGGTINQPGMVLVGERGPELLHLPRGAQVEPLDQDKTPIQVTNNFYTNRELDEEESTRKIELVFRRLELEYGRRF